MSTISTHLNAPSAPGLDQNWSADASVSSIIQSRIPSQEQRLPATAHCPVHFVFIPPRTISCPAPSQANAKLVPCAPCQPSSLGLRSGCSESQPPASPPRRASSANLQDSRSALHRHQSPWLVSSQSRTDCSIGILSFGSPSWLGEHQVRIRNYRLPRSLDSPCTCLTRPSLLVHDLQAKPW